MPKHALDSYGLSFKFTSGLKNETSSIISLINDWCTQLQHVESVCQQLLTKAMANENHTKFGRKCEMHQKNFAH